MYRLTATFIKELKLLIVDKTGITILFIMPVLLVFIMTLIQHEAYKSLTQSGIPVLLINKDKDSLGVAIENGFKKSPVCALSVDDGRKYKTVASIQHEIVEGKFLIAVIIPENATAHLRKNVNEIMSHIFDTTKKAALKHEDVPIEIITDPTASKSFVIAITSSLKEFIATVETKVLFQLLGKNVSDIFGSNRKIPIPDADFFVYKESFAQRDEHRMYQPNAVQHNVPAWSIFSVFFIVLPLAGSIINERSEGLFIRLRTFPGNYLSILSGKLMIYFFIALLQFCLVLVVGKFILPLLGLPVLDLGTHTFALVSLTVLVAIAAVSYGLLIGTLFDTPQQSAVFGGISILIMSALGGIWVPLNIMPRTMQAVSNCSPLNWALKGYYELFIKGGGWFEIRFQLLKLSIFFVSSLIVAYRLYLLKTRID